MTLTAESKKTPRASRSVTQKKGKGGRSEGNKKLGEYPERSLGTAAQDHARTMMLLDTNVGWYRIYFPAVELIEPATVS